MDNKILFSLSLEILPPADAAANLGFFVKSIDRHDSEEKILFQSEISKFFSLMISDKYTEIL